MAAACREHIVAAHCRDLAGKHRNSAAEFENLLAKMCNRDAQRITKDQWLRLRGLLVRLFSDSASAAKFTADRLDEIAETIDDRHPRTRHSD